MFAYCDVRNEFKLQRSKYVSSLAELQTPTMPSNNVPNDSKLCQPHWKCVEQDVSQRQHRGARLGKGRDRYITQQFHLKNQACMEMIVALMSNIMKQTRYFIWLPSLRPHCPLGYFGNLPMRCTFKLISARGQRSAATMYQANGWEKHIPLLWFESEIPIYFQRMMMQYGLFPCTSASKKSYII